jgi:predicted dehydrogenase
MDEIRWGMIGCGNVTMLKSAPALNKIEHSRLVAVTSRHEENARNYAVQNGIPNVFPDAGQLIADPDVNAVYVATPPDTHASYAIASMRAGKPVYVEKPMARTYRECQEMIKVSEETGVPLFVAYYRRSLPAFLEVKKLIEDGVIGKPLTVNIRLFKQPREQDLNPAKQSWHVKPQIAGGGYFYDLASHQFDYLDFVFGPVTEVKGIARNLAGLYEAEDVVSAAFSFQNGVTGTGSWNFVAAKGSEEDVIEISGTKGKLVFSSFLHGDVSLVTADGTKSFRFQNPENIQYNLIGQVVKELRGEGKCAGNGVSAARTNRVLEQVLKG